MYRTSLFANSNTQPEISYKVIHNEIASFDNRKRIIAFTNIKAFTTAGKIFANRCFENSGNSVLERKNAFL